MCAAGSQAGLLLRGAAGHAAAQLPCLAGSVGEERGALACVRISRRGGAARAQHRRGSSPQWWTLPPAARQCGTPPVCPCGTTRVATCRAAVMGPYATAVPGNAGLARRRQRCGRMGHAVSARERAWRIPHFASQRVRTLATHPSPPLPLPPHALTRWSTWNW